MRFHYIINEYSMSLLSLSWNHNDFTIKSRVYYEFNIFLADKLSIYNLFANSSWINFEFSAWTMNSLSILRIHYEFTVFIKNLVRICHSLGPSRSYHESTIVLFAKWPWMNCLFRESTMHFLSFLRIHYVFSMFVAFLL